MLTDELAILRGRIARLSMGADDQTDRGRALQPPYPQAVVEEIELTQLPRKLTFSTDRGDVLAATVKAGRLLQIDPETTVTGDALGTQISGCPLEDGDEAVADLLADLFGRFTKDAGGIWVNSTYLEVSELGAHTGVIAPVIARQTAAGKGPLAEFADILGPIAEALLWFERSTLVARRGGEDLLQVLDDLAKAEMADFSADIWDQGANCVILGGTGPRNHVVLCATAAQSLIFAVLDGAQAGRLIRCWVEIQT